MKIVELHRDIHSWINRAIRGDRKAQKLIYEQYSSRVLSICRQYIADDFIAEDLMISTFMKVFRNLEHYAQKGVFEAWIRRIAVNECITYIRSRKKVTYTEPEEWVAISDTRTDEGLIISDLQAMLDQLPDGCRTIFNLYAIDGYKHHEIAKMMDISEGTSKSQLAYARKLLQQVLHQNNISNHG